MGRLTNYIAANARIAFGKRPKGTKWPPGALDVFSSVNKQAQSYLLGRFRRLGPVFKIWMYGTHTTCIVGLERGRRFLRDHAPDLRGVTIDQSGIYPKGNLRMMEDEEHRSYRRTILDTINAVSLADVGDVAVAIVHRHLAACAEEADGSPVAPESLRAALHAALTEIMLRITFGAEPGTDAMDGLIAGYRVLGEKAPVNRVGDVQKDAFMQISEVVAKLEAREDKASWLGFLVRTGRLDPTLRGNLVYLVETVRFDVSSLWRWMLYHVGGAPDVVARLKDGGFAEPDYLKAVVMETLRLNQSEYLARRVQRDISFDGHLLPAGTRARVCVWESHKDPDVFDDPFRFDPDRFVGKEYPVDVYSPFGMDKHRCLGVDFTHDVSSLFLRTLFESFDCEGVNIGEPYRGKHHWEPNPEFTIRLTQRQTGSALS